MFILKCLAMILVVCPDGHSKVAGIDECELCAEGTFRAKDIDMVTSQTCTSCPQYFTTASTGAVTNASCDIRKYRYPRSP